MRHVEIQDGVGPVALPNGNVYQEGDDAYLTEEQWDELTAGAKANLITLLGTSGDPGDDTAAIASNAAADALEAATRSGADVTLTSAISAETAARIAADALKAPLVSQLKVVAVKTANYTAAPGEFVPVDTTAGTPVITLPTNPDDATTIAVKRTVGVTNNASVVCGGSDVFNVTGGTATSTISLLNMTQTYTYAKATHIWYVETAIPKGTLDGLYSGKLLGWGQNTSDTTMGASVTAISLIGGGLSVPVTVGTKPVKIDYGGICYHSGGNQGPGLALYEDGVKVDQVYFSTGIANQQVPLQRNIVRQPSAGAHTYEIKVYQTIAAATAHAFGSAATPITLGIAEG
jgi:hypothetical protein